MRITVPRRCASSSSMRQPCVRPSLPTPTARACAAGREGGRPCLVGDDSGNSSAHSSTSMAVLLKLCSTELAQPRERTGEVFHRLLLDPVSLQEEAYLLATLLEPGSIDGNAETEFRRSHAASFLSSLSVAQGCPASRGSWEEEEEARTTFDRFRHQITPRAAHCEGVWRLKVARTAIGRRFASARLLSLRS
jgi:hypothetical protein